ncbi:MAG: hypothetical protein RBR43_01600 [Desulfuromonadaceae bacterium]|nr:hypothetical protein [Desulfuromonas sp.]MDY0184559.1 hypothetical protein [Desulfuromonadaceae bacterium]
MTAKKKLLVNIFLLLVCVTIAGLAVLYNYSYKICWHCDTDDYYERGRAFVCKEKEELRESGLDFLRLAASRQQVGAQLLLAECYVGQLPQGYTPVDERAYACLATSLVTNTAAARQFFNKAHATLATREGVEPKVQHNLGLLLEAGILEAQDAPQLALEYFTLAARQSYFPAMQHLGMLYHNRSAYVEARTWLEQAAAQHKDMQPALLLGDYYMQGKGVAIELEKAMHWYRQALLTAKKTSVGLAQNVQLAAEDVPRARMDMAMRKLQQERMFKFMTLYYSVGGDASTYEVYCEDSPGLMIGTVERNVEGVVANLAPGLKRSAAVVTPQKTFSSMNKGLDWVLTAYAKGRYGDFTKFDFRLRSPQARDGNRLDTE